MNAAVLQVDATAVAVNILRSELSARSDDAKVGSRIPNPRPARLVVVRRTGGARLNLVADDPELTFETWDTTEAAAHDLAQLCRALIWSARGTSQAGVAIYRVAELGGVVPLPDPLSDSPRCTFTLQVAMRGAPLT